MLCFRVVSLWKDKVAPMNQKVADSLADPTKYENLFPGLKDSFKGEQYLRHLSTRPIPAAAYVNVPVTRRDETKFRKGLIF